MAALLLYEPLTTQILWLPPLFGLVVWGVYAAKGYERAVWLLYLYIYQADHGLDFFILFFVLFLTIKALDVLARFFACRLCLKFLGVVIFYGILLVSFWGLETLFMHQYSISYSLIALYMLLDLIVVGLYEN